MGSHYKMERPQTISYKSMHIGADTQQYYRYYLKKINLLFRKIKIPPYCHSSIQRYPTSLITHDYFSSCEWPLFLPPHTPGNSPVMLFLSNRYCQKFTFTNENSIK